MHTISNERALAHRQALNRLPVSAMNFLKARFLREQPILAGVVLPLADGLVTGPDRQEKIRDEDDPKLADFWRLATTGAVMNEILCREVAPGNANARQPGVRSRTANTNPRSRKR